MSVVDVHPEDLIDREARGSLSAEERAHLEAHLARCTACRLERQVRADFAVELTPRRGSAGMHEIVYGALQVAQDARVAAGSDVQPPAAKPRRFRTLAWLVAVPALLVSGLAFAHTELAVRVVELARETLGISVSSAPAEHPSKPARRAPLPATSSAPTPAAVRASALASAPAAAPLPEPAVGVGVGVEGAGARAGTASVVESSTASSRGRALARSRRARASTRTPSPVPQAITASPAPAPAPQTIAVTAQSLFERANAARRAGRMLEASALYRELHTRFSASSEARVALVLLARLQLDGGESESALAGFEAYLDSGHAALREQAMVGRAQALRKLGRDAEEHAAVRALLRAYPDAPYARLARERLEISEP